MKIDIHERRFDVSFETRLILSEMVMFSNPPTPLSEELLHSDPRIVQGAFDKLAQILTGRQAPSAQGTVSDARTPSLMDQDPETLRRVAGQVEDLLTEIKIDIDSIEQFRSEGESIEDLRRIIGEDVLPLEKEGTLRLHYLGARCNGQERVLACVGNSPRAQAIGAAIAIGLHLLPTWIRTLRGTADSRDAAREMVRAAALRRREVSDGELR